MDLTGKTVVFTGEFAWPRARLVQELERLGGKVATRVTAETDLLVVGEDAGSRLLEARALCVSTVGEAAFRKMLEGAPRQWRLGEGGTVVDRRSDMLVAEVPQTLSRGADEVREIARFIAAAPRTIEALRETTDILARIYRGEPVTGEVLDAVDSARAAIAAAEGRS